MKLQYYETCNSQYHRGHHLPTVQVMVDGNSTYLDVQEALKDNFAYDHLEEREFKAESHYDAYREAVDAWFNNRQVSLDSKWDSGLEVPENEEDWEHWDCYAYFIIEGVNEHLVQALREHPNTCPFCGSENLEAGKISAGDDGLSVKVTCMDCSEGWTEEHTLAEVTFDGE